MDGPEQEAPKFTFSEGWMLGVLYLTQTFAIVMGLFGAVFAVSWIAVAIGGEAIERPAMVIVSWILLMAFSVLMFRIAGRLRRKLEAQAKFWSGNR